MAANRFESDQRSGNLRQSLVTALILGQCGSVR
ncbi:hypothetical protein W823_01195 [Williamsia sp. D3]|jgi:hypothetical protein|nr:hypothetical protein W823_01195 [Williamsia sp. D3]